MCETVYDPSILPYIDLFTIFLDPSIHHMGKMRDYFLISLCTYLKNILNYIHSNINLDILIIRVYLQQSVVPYKRKFSRVSKDLWTLDRGRPPSKAEKLKYLLYTQLFAKLEEILFILTLRYYLHLNFHSFRWDNL